MNIFYKSICLHLLVWSVMYPFSWGDMWHAVTHVVEGAVHDVEQGVTGGGGSSGDAAQLQADAAQIRANEEYQKQQQHIIAQYQKALAQEEQVVSQLQTLVGAERGIIETEEAKIFRCNFEKQMLLALVAYAPPKNDPEVYKLMVLITLIGALKNPKLQLEIYDSYTLTQFLKLAMKFVSFGNDDLQKLITQFKKLCSCYPYKASISNPG